MLAVAYLKLKQPERAKQMLDHGEETRARQRRDLPGGGQLLSRGARLQGRDRDAEERAAHDAGVLADLGYTYELDGDKQQAAEAYARAANEKPKEIGYQLSAAAGAIAAWRH